MFLMPNNFNAKDGYHLNAKLRKEGDTYKGLIGVTRDITHSHTHIHSLRILTKQQSSILRSDSTTASRLFSLNEVMES